MFAYAMWTRASARAAWVWDNASNWSMRPGSAARSRIAGRPPGPHNACEKLSARFRAQI